MKERRDISLTDGYEMVRMELEAKLLKWNAGFSVM